MLVNLFSEIKLLWFPVVASCVKRKKKPKKKKIKKQTNKKKQKTNIKIKKMNVPQQRTEMGDATSCEPAEAAVHPERARLDNISFG